MKALPSALAFSFLVLGVSACAPAEPSFSGFQTPPSSPATSVPTLGRSTGTGSGAGPVDTRTGGTNEGSFEPSAGVPSAVAAPVGPLGRKISFASVEEKAHFGVQYAFERAHKLWTTTLTVQGRDLAAPNTPVGVIAWRLYDLGKQRWINAWVVDHRDPTYFPGTMAFSFGINDESEVREAIAAKQDLVIALSVNRPEARLEPTHHLYIGEYCLSEPGHFLNLSTGENGCGKGAPQPQPALPQLLPIKAKSLSRSVLARQGEGYCAGVTELAQRLSARSPAPTANARAEMAREQKLARAICDSSSKFVGYSQLKEPSSRVVAEVSALEDAIWRLQAIAQIAGEDAFRGKYISLFERLKRDKSIFFDRPLAEIFSPDDIYSGELSERIRELEQYGIALNEFHRNR